MLLYGERHNSVCWGWISFLAGMKVWFDLVKRGLAAFYHVACVLLRRISLCSTFCFCFFIAGLGGCTVGPDYCPPKVVVPDIWEQRAVEGINTGRADLQVWWSVLGDEVLNDLMMRAYDGNLDIRQAYFRVLQGRANLGIATGELYPQVDGIGGYSRQRFSDNGLQAGRTSQNKANLDLHDLGVDSTWEIDVFGRIRRNIESAKAGLEASVEDWRDLLVSLYADVAINYIELRALQKRIEFAESNVELQRKTLQLTKDLFKAGIVPQLDVRQAELNLATTESEIPPLRSGVVAASNRIAVLVGGWPGELKGLLGVEDIPDVPEGIAVGLPVELLRQRPDVRFAERVLASQTAQIGAATAELYPIFSLTGTFAYQSRQINQLFDKSSRRYLFGPEFRWNLFDGDRVRSNIRFEEALASEAYANYENTVLKSFEEVENSMTAFVQEKERMQSLGRSVVAAEESVELVETLYKNGLTDFQNVLDMQRSLFNQQDRFVESRGLVVQNLVEIYRSLGGGWGSGKE